MNDRYLYRAKRIDNGEWVEGSLITGVFFRLGQDIPYILCPDKADYDCFEDFSEENGIFEVDSSTICQCTGLKDKNGMLIWENDIVKEFNSSGDEWNLSQIVFGEYSLNLGWCTKGIKTLHEYNRRLFNVGFGTSEAGKCEVIGNIFDNPEPLESKGCD